MTDHHPPPPIITHHRTATQTLHHTTTVIFTTTHNLRSLLILSFLLFSLRNNLETLTNYITNYIDSDPDIQTLLSRTQPDPNPTIPISPTARHHRRRPFLQLTRVGTLDDDFFSGDEEIDHRFFGNLGKKHGNETNFIIDAFDPQLGFSNLVIDNGIRVSEVVRSEAKLTFRLIKIVDKGNGSLLVDDVKNETEANLGFLFIRVGIEEHELNTLLWLIGVLSGSYGVTILVYVFTYVWVHGVVFVLVVNDLLKKDGSFREIFEKGAILGSRRLSGLVIMRWVVRDAWTQLLGLYFFGEIEDQYSLFKIFIRLKFMPFSMLSPWVKGFEKEIYGFLLSWYLIDLVMSFVFALDAWVAMVDSRKTGKEVIKEGFRLLSLMINPAINLKCLEGIACGSFARHVLTHFFGKLFASVVQSFIEVYFMVAWMMHYLSVKSMDARNNGVPFGQRELEDMIRDDR